MATVSRMRPSCICSTGDSWKVFTPSLEGEAEQYSKSNPLTKFTLDPLVQLKHNTKFDTVVQKSGEPPGMYTTGAGQISEASNTHRNPCSGYKPWERHPFLRPAYQIVKLELPRNVLGFLAISWGENKPYHLTCSIYVFAKKRHIFERTKTIYLQILYYDYFTYVYINIFIHIFLISFSGAVGHALGPQYHCLHMVALKPSICCYHGVELADSNPGKGRDLIVPVTEAWKTYLKWIRCQQGYKSFDVSWVKQGWPI